MSDSEVEAGLLPQCNKHCPIVSAGPHTDISALGDDFSNKLPNLDNKLTRAWPQSRQTNYHCENTVETPSTDNSTH